MNELVREVGFYVLMGIRLKDLFGSYKEDVFDKNIDVELFIFI